MDSFHLLVFYVVDLIELINNKLTRPKFILRHLYAAANVCRQHRRVGRAVRAALSLSFHICTSDVGVQFIRSKLHNQLIDLGHGYGYSTVCWGGLRKKQQQTSYVLGHISSQLLTSLLQNIFMVSGVCE